MYELLTYDNSALNKNRLKRCTEGRTPYLHLFSRSSYNLYPTFSPWPEKFEATVQTRAWEATAHRGMRKQSSQRQVRNHKLRSIEKLRCFWHICIFQKLIHTHNHSYWFRHESVRTCTANIHTHTPGTMNVCASDPIRFRRCVLEHVADISKQSKRDICRKA